MPLYFNTEMRKKIRECSRIRDCGDTIEPVLTGRLLRMRLWKAGLSVRQVQGVLGLECPQSIYRWLSGQALPSVENLYILHRLLGCSMDKLIVTRDRPDLLRCAAYYTALGDL